jgi:hypothetical protein
VRLASLLRRLWTPDFGNWPASDKDASMAEDWVRHARMFFNRPDFDLASAAPGSYMLSPHDGMLTDLRRDYAAMSGLIFGPISAVDQVVEAISELEHLLNRNAHSA